MHTTNTTNVNTHYREKYTFCIIKSLEHQKYLKMAFTLFRPKIKHTCHQKPNPSRETVPLNLTHIYALNSVPSPSSSCFPAIRKVTSRAESKFENQCCRSRSWSAWIHTDYGQPDPELDPGGEKWPIKRVDMNCLEVLLDVLFWGLKASLVV